MSGKNERGTLIDCPKNERWCSWYINVYWVHIADVKRPLLKANFVAMTIERKVFSVVKSINCFIWSRKVSAKLLEFMTFSSSTSLDLTLIIQHPRINSPLSKQVLPHPSFNVALVQYWVSMSLKSSPEKDKT